MKLHNTGCIPLEYSFEICAFEPCTEVMCSDEDRSTSDDSCDNECEPTADCEPTIIYADGKTAPSASKEKNKNNNNNAESKRDSNNNAAVPKKGSDKSSTTLPDKTSTANEEIDPCPMFCEPCPGTPCYVRLQCQPVDMTEWECPCTPFSVEPECGFVPPGCVADVCVKFSPLDVGCHHAKLTCGYVS